MIPTLLALKDNRFIEFVGPLFVLANIIVIFVVNNIAEDIILFLARFIEI